jgi:ABC-2 type transport system permease protein
MRQFGILVKNELFMLFVSPATYVTTVLFHLLTASFYILILADYTDIPSEDIPMVVFFRLFWTVALFVAPLLTMRSISEERRLGTLQTLMTTPTTTTQFVLSKFFSVYALYMLLWLSTLLYPVLVSIAVPGLGQQIPLLDPATIVGGFLFLSLSGLLIISVGIFSSSITRSVMVAAIFSFTLLFFIIASGGLIEKLADNMPGRIDFLDGPAEYLRMFQHLEDFIHGILDTRPFVYYITGAGVFLALSTIIVDAKVDS